MRVDALPAVTVPPSRNAGCSAASFSSVVSARGPSSASTVTVSPRLPLGASTGTSCSANRPSAWAATARWWLRSAKASWSARETP